jgi:hypothetical protein
VWTLPEQVSGADLVLRALTHSRRATPALAAVAANPDGPYDRANLDQHSWGPRRPGSLDTVGTDVVGRLKYVGFDAGVRVCVSSLAVGHVSTAR